MNRLEFNEVLKTLGINNPLISTKGRYGESEQVHFWQNIAIYFGGSYYTVVRGKVPLEVANIIYQKYPNNPYEIRVDGGCNDYVPNEHAVDDKYKREIQEHIEKEHTSDEYLENCKRSRKNLLRRKSDNKYIETYHIDSKEGLVILLTELKDYYARKQGLPETEVQKFDDIMFSINTEILRRVNPNITTYDWMQGSKECSQLFNETLQKNETTGYGRALRRLIDKFDKTINPFINEEIELDSMENYLQNVTINSNTYNSVNGEYRKNCCYVSIKDKKTNNEVKYYRNPNGFSYQLMYCFGPKQYATVLHYFDEKDSIGINDTKEKSGEYIYIEYFGDNVKDKVDIRYNITHDIAGKTYKTKKPITQEQKDYIYAQLEYAIELASTITIDNMKKKGYSKKLVSDKK